ncbi:MAG: hypothetical protein U0931_15465 [Vulcanimicrobiota bacterium]
MANYERSDARPGRLLAFGLAVLLLVLLSAGLAGLLHRQWRLAAGPLTPPIPLEPRPLVGRDPPELHQRAWLDRKTGLVQIPIEEAVNVLASAHQSYVVPPQPVGRENAPVRAAPGGSAAGPVEPDR